MHFNLSRPRTLGSLPVDPGPLGFGCWRFGDPDIGKATTLVETALDHGLTLVDTADIYGLGDDGRGFGRNEEILGQVLAASPGLRSRMILATKGGIVPGVPYDSSARHLIEACEASLRRLGTDVIDLYQIHRPDMFAHPAEVADALDRLATSGKIREYGVSNYTPNQHEALAACCHRDIASTQPEFSAAHLAPLRDGTLDLAMRLGVRPLAWSPLAGGRIPNGTDLPGRLGATLDTLAAREGTTRANVALAFVLAHPSRPVAILGTQRPGRIVESLGALEVRLSRQDVYEIVEASEGVALP